MWCSYLSYSHYVPALHCLFYILYVVEFYALSSANASQESCLGNVLN